MMLLPSLLAFSPGGRPVRSPTERVERAPSERARSASRRTTRLPPPLSPLFEQPLKPRLNLVQPLAQVGLKNIGLGLHHQALGLELLLEQHHLGE
jgi:hypothetical protein